MDALTLVSEARAAGLHLTVVGDKLVVKGPGRAEAIAQQLLAHKHAVIAVIEPIRSPWDEPLADALIQIALASVSRAYDELAPGCPVDGPGWDEAEALVEAALRMRNVPALRDSLAGYEQHARGCFVGWARGATDDNCDGDAACNT